MEIRADQQKSDLWHTRRKGKATASQFEKIGLSYNRDINSKALKADLVAYILPRRIADEDELKSMKVTELKEIIESMPYDSIGLTTGAETYLCDIIADYTNVPDDDEPPQPYAIAWGNMYEAFAQSHYQKLFNCTIETAYFHEYNGSVKELIGWVGGTSDGTDRESEPEPILLEFKCPFNSGKHIKYMRDPESFKNEYWEQVQGNLFIQNLKRSRLISYDPRKEKESLKMLVVEIERDDDFIKKVLIPKLIVFVKELKESLKLIINTKKEDG